MRNHGRDLRDFIGVGLRNYVREFEVGTRLLSCSEFTKLFLLLSPVHPVDRSGLVQFACGVSEDQLACGTGSERCLTVY